MSTYFDDHMSACLYAFKLIGLDSLMITNPYVEMLCMFTCLINHVLTYVLALTIIFSHFYLLPWSYVCRFTYFDVHMTLYSHALIITHTSMFTCFDNHMPHVYMLWREHFHLLTCLNAHMPEHFFDCMLLWSYALMFTCFVDHMLLRSHASMIVYSYVYILWWSHVRLPVCLQAHRLGLIDDYLPLCWNALYVYMPYWSCAHICTCFDDNILTCLPAFMIICF